jgi:hypothetical protein
MFKIPSKTARKAVNIGLFLLMLLSAGFGAVTPAKADISQQSLSYAIVFVSRKIPTNGSVYYPSGGSMPGVMPYSRFQLAAPGKLIVREANGTMRTLVDGAVPTAASLNLIDVNAPDVSFDGTKIVFAGLPNGSYSSSVMNNPGAWRLYIINVDGTGLRQLTFSDQNLNMSQFGGVGSSLSRYDDTDPAWLPDGRVVFSSTRWPSFGMYGAARTSNLYVVNADGSNLHRITSERNGADRPLVDPLTGKIVFARWWRNLRVATNDMGTIPDPRGGYIMKDGLCAINSSGSQCFEPGGKFNMERNSWFLASINPDGTGLEQFAGQSNTTFNGSLVNHAYGGSFAPDGSIYTTFFPMTNGTEAAGFGGIRRYQRGPKGYTHIIGITTRDESVQQFVKTNPNSYGVYVGNYAGEPEVLPDGRVLISWAQDAAQDYGLYIINADGSGLTKLYDNVGTTELRARIIRTRSAPIIADKVTQKANPLPPLAQGPYNTDGTFTFQALNVYFNAPVDVNILNAMPVGSANTIRFYIDHQRSQQTGSIEAFDWPILLEEVLINPDGSVTAQSPANVPLFEQIRSAQPGYEVPLVGNNKFYFESSGAAHVAGENYGRPGAVASCVGCHAGHTMINVPSPAEAKWTNLATGATVTVSSTGNGSAKGINDRRVKMSIPNGATPRYWASSSGNPSAQWVVLTFPVPVTVRTVRLYNPAASDSSNKVLDATIRLYSDAAGTVEVASKNSGPLSDAGTNVDFPEVFTRVVRVQFISVSGNAAALGEIEVIARAEAANATGGPTATAGPSETPTLTPTATETVTSPPTETATNTPSGSVTATNTFTATPTTVNANTPTATSTSTGAPAITSSATFTNTPLPTATSLPTQTKPAATNTSVPGSPFIKTIFPTAWTTDKGATSGSLSSLSLLDQKGAEDNPQAYVSFQTPNSTYSGYQSFFLPSDVNGAEIKTMALEVNYKAPAPAVQKWTIFVYDWKSKKWLNIGATSVDSSKEWRKHVFTLPNVARYISPNGEIRIQLKSNNANGDAFLDYEAIHLGVGMTLPQTITSPTGNTAASATPTLAPAQSQSNTPTATAIVPSPTATSTPQTP